MNCNLPKARKPQNYKPPTYDEIVQSMSRDVVQQFQDEIKNQTLRRMLKAMCIMLNERHGHGQMRLTGDVQHIADIFSDEASHDEEFWYHVDQRLDQIGITFFTPEEIALKQKKQPML